MPQLDILTFLIQISLTKFLFWVLLLLFQLLILPHFIYFFINKELIWNNINKFCLLIKCSLNLLFLHILNLVSKIFVLKSKFLTGLKIYSLRLTVSFLKLIQTTENLFKFKSLNIATYLNKQVAIFKDLNFLLLSSKKFNFRKKYDLRGYNEKNLLTKNIHSRIIVKNTRKYRLLEDETRINNLIKGPQIDWLSLISKLRGNLVLDIKKC